MRVPVMFYSVRELTLLAATLPLCSVMAGTDDAGRHTPRFERDVAPLLTRACHECHGGETREAGLDLRTVTAMLRGGGGGPVLVPGHPDRSDLVEMVLTGKMPPKGEPPLTVAERDTIRRWVAAGAPADEKICPPSPADFIQGADRKHWAFRPFGPIPAAPHIPGLEGADRRTDEPRSQLDAFLLAKLAPFGLSFAGEAARETLIRRLSLDLLGLPPSLEEIDAFVGDSRPDAYERLVDRLIASPHFGERWGRHWLDAAGYVDVYGSDNDAGIMKPLPGKWRYRDYVIRSFNADRPFNEFLTEQLAGDELADWRNAAEFTPEILDALTATGFLLAAADDTDQPELNTPDIRHRVLQLTGETVANNLLALTLNCAKCHNHKYEPLPQLDYYRWLAVFSPVFDPEHWTTSTSHGMADVSPARQAAIDRQNAVLDEQIKALQIRQNDVRAATQQRLRDTKLAQLPESVRDDVRVAVETPPEKRSDVQKYLAEKLGPAVQVSVEEVAAGLTDAERDSIADLDRQIAGLSAQRQRYETIQVAQVTSPSAKTYLLRRGDHLKPLLEVTPGVATVLEIPAAPGMPPDRRANAAGRRFSLARELTDPATRSGALVARVQVNRIWQQLFGRGLVETSDNFGKSGAMPSHPELLEWLAAEFIRQEWRFKPIIRMIVTSAAYRQNSVRNDAAVGRGKEIDPENLLLWKMRLRRLESEPIRDVLLSISGQLEPSLYGPPLALAVQPDGKVIVNRSALQRPADEFRRSIYVLARRNYHLSLLATFDQPVLSTNCTRRSPSAVVTQALTVLNDDFVREQSQHLARRMLTETPADQRITVLFRLVLGRIPDADEKSWCMQMEERQRQRFLQAGGSVGAAELNAMTEVCHTLLNTSELLYVP